MRTVKRVFVGFYLIALHAVVLYFIGERIIANYTRIDPIPEEIISDPTRNTPIPAPSEVPHAFVDQIDANVKPSPVVPDGSGLLIPVVGVKPEQLTDTFSTSRSADRFHDAIDIPATAGTPVVAAFDGEIVKLFDSEAGGITIYQTTADKKFVLYYAHLQRRTDAIHVGQLVKRGEVIAYVGDSGNAGAGNYHLHFSIARITNPNRIWEGQYINPYPLLRNGLYPD